MKLEKIKSYLYAKCPKIIKDYSTLPVIISLMVALAVSFIVLYISISNNDYNNNFGEGVRVEAHGMLFDLWIIGVFILFLNEIARKRSDNQKYRDEIDDFRRWESEEAKYRIVGNIKRLNRNNVTDINLSGCYLKKANLCLANLKKARLFCANLQGATLIRADLQKADIQRVNLQGANLDEANLQRSSLRNANLKGATFQRANFEGTSLKGVDFQEAYLNGAQNLTIEQLSKVKTLYLAELDLELKEQIKKKYPILLEKPNILTLLDR